MSQQFELTITGTIPDGNHDIGPEAQVSTREPAHAIVEALHKLGLLHVTQTRRVVRKKDAKDAKDAPVIEFASRAAAAE